MDMTHGDFQEVRPIQPVVEMREAEKEFLKDLHTFMKKRDTPIERIPNLGFKQIDLYVMYTTVRDLGGYHQVTSQQLWKQVYNLLGGNPRSTSAATCTRRHYEKLLLPYECHVKGVSINILTHHRQKHYSYANSSKDDDGQRPAKRKLLSIPLHQNPHAPQSDQHRSTFPLQLHYPCFYQASHAVLPPHAPISSSVLTPQSTPAPQPQFSFDPYRPNPTERLTEPLEHLRFLAERYKTSSGLTEPLNLSIKAPRRETTSNPVSSFAPPPSSKNPKFLNKPSPLYTAHGQQVVRSETQDGEASSGEAHPYPVKDSEAYVIDVDAITASSSPTYDSVPTFGTDQGATTMPQNPSTPKTDFTLQPTEEREGSPDVRELNLGHILPGLSRENGGEMEIEIPLSMFHNWLRLCSSSATVRGNKQLPPLPTLEEHSGQRKCSNTDVLPTNLTCRMNPQQLSSIAEDLRLRQRNVPSPMPTIQTAVNHPNTSQNPFLGYKPLPSGGILKNAASRDVYSLDQQDINKSYSSKPANCWDAYDQVRKSPPFQVKIDCNPPTVQQHFAAPKSYNEDIMQGGKRRLETGPSAVLMMNSGSTSLLHLTSEEVMKLKKIISSSS